MHHIKQLIVYLAYDASGNSIYHPLQEPGEDYCTLQNIDRHQQPVKATMSIWMKAADDMYEEVLEHMDM